MKNGSFCNKQGQSRLGRVLLRRTAAAALAGCLLACALAACGGDDKGKESSGESSGTASVAPVATPNPTPAPAAKAVRITGDEVNVRKEASTDSDVLGTVEEGDKLALLAENAQGEWYNVQFEGSGAYVYADFGEVVDVTAEDYARLMAAPDPTPEATQSPEGSASPSASPEGEGASSPSSSLVDDEDGE